MPSEPDAPDTAYEKLETRERVRAAIQSLPWRERKVIGLYYYGEVTMKQIGAEIGVNESRVSQLHARAIRRLRDALGEMGPQQVAEMRKAARRVRQPEADDGEGGRCRSRAERPAAPPAVVLPYKPRDARLRASRRCKPRHATAVAAARGKIAPRSAQASPRRRRSASVAIPTPSPPEPPSADRPA